MQKERMLWKKNKNKKWNIENKQNKKIKQTIKMIESFPLTWCDVEKLCKCDANQ